MPEELTPQLPVAPCTGTPEELRVWRKEVRRTLIARRFALAPAVRHAMAEQAVRRLEESVNLRQYGSIGFYWPIEAELDCLDLMRRLAGTEMDAGTTVALPVVIEKAKPVEFWKWTPGSAMQRGLWDIPVPAERVVVQPEALVIPLVGVDAAGYRLGYGGGYYDRTIAAASRKPFCIGMGFSVGMLSSICPQAHDIRMDVVVTDEGVTFHN